MGPGTPSGPKRRESQPGSAGHKSGVPACWGGSQGPAGALAPRSCPFCPAHSQGALFQPRGALLCSVAPLRLSDTCPSFSPVHIPSLLRTAWMHLLLGEPSLKSELFSVPCRRPCSLVFCPAAFHGPRCRCCQNGGDSGAGPVLYSEPAPRRRCPRGREWPVSPAPASPWQACPRSQRALVAL